MGAAGEEEAMADAAEGELSGEGVVWEELPAPPAWKKKVAQRRGGTPRRGDVTFVAPDGEEIKSKRQLERYLKTNPGGPPIAEFDWSTGETPRRSERLSSRKRPTDFEVEPTTPKRGGRKKKAATTTTTPTAATAAGTEKEEDSAAGKEPVSEKLEPSAAAAAATAATANEEQEKKQASVAEKGEGEETAAAGPEVQEAQVKKAPAISCAKTETSLAKSQEAQPAQIGVSS